MELIAGILFAVAFGFVCYEDWDDVRNFLVTSLLAFLMFVLAYGAFWLMGQLVP